ncbi:MAG TPA: hypothetical protein VGM13_13615 [Thermoanaerobaculia bacterium]
MRAGPLAAALAALAAAFVLTSCGSAETPTQPSSCVPLTGQYAGTFTDSCGVRTLDVTLFQTGCKVVADLPGVGTLTGNVSGATLVFAVGFSPCGGSASGTLTLGADGGLTGTYTGQATGGGACCGAVSGSVVLVRR